MMNNLNKRNHELSQDILPGEEKEDEGAPTVEGLEPEADQQELAQPKMGVSMEMVQRAESTRSPLACDNLFSNVLLLCNNCRSQEISHTIN